VQVYRDEKNIKGSPFPVSVKDSDIAHAGKIHINGALTSAIANESNNIAIDAACSFHHDIPAQNNHQPS
jgi:hypothetical protein